MNAMVECDCCGREVPEDEINHIRLPNNAGIETYACNECCHPEAEPCTQDAINLGCICTIPIAGPTDIDPPEPRRNIHCPLHGHPDREYEHEDKLERERNE